MNWLITLWAVCVVLLSGLPCPDSDCCVYDQPVSQHADLPGHADDHAPCSPFCHCAACVGFVMPQPASQILLPASFLALLQSPQFDYLFQVSDDVLMAVWQPPKV